jgi:hypothetical protein
MIWILIRYNFIAISLILRSLNVRRDKNLRHLNFRTYHFIIDLAFSQLCVPAQSIWMNRLHSFIDLPIFFSVLGVKSAGICVIYRNLILLLLYLGSAEALYLGCSKSHHIVIAVEMWGCGVVELRPLSEIGIAHPRLIDHIEQLIRFLLVCFQIFNQLIQCVIGRLDLLRLYQLRRHPLLGLRLKQHGVSKVRIVMCRLYYQLWGVGFMA